MISLAPGGFVSLAGAAGIHLCCACSGQRAAQTVYLHQSEPQSSREYYPALHWNLCVRLFPQYQRPIDPEVKALAADALNVLREANVQVGRLFMPEDLVRPGIYNPYSDQIR